MFYNKRKEEAKKLRLYSWENGAQVALCVLLDGAVRLLCFLGGKKRKRRKDMLKWKLGV
jgi:hypothetical protein